LNYTRIFIWNAIYNITKANNCQVFFEKYIFGGSQMRNTFDTALAANKVFGKKAIIQLPRHAFVCR